MPLESFNSAMQPLFATFQLMGMFPIYGILRRNPTDLHFRWLALRTAFSLVIMLIGLVMVYIEYERLDRVGVNARNVIGIVFYADTVLSMVLLVNLAKNWRSLAVCFESAHQTFAISISDDEEGIGKATKKRGMHYIIRVTAAVVIACGILEHFLSKTSDVYNQYHEAKFCHWDVSNFPRYFASRNYSFVFKHIPYNILILLCFELSATALTMAWTCQDLMIILTSLAITFYFRRLHDRVQLFSNGIMIAHEKFWIEIRSQYMVLCELVSETNKRITIIIVHSCGKNLYLMCYELINIYKKDETITSALHHWFALAYLIFKTCLVFYSAAMITETAKAPLAICTKIPNIGWCQELDRFTGQLRFDRVALTGMGFFHLTKRTMLAMAGTVVTYELVMLKFAEDTEGIGDVAPCSRLAFSKDA